MHCHERLLVITIITSAEEGGYVYGSVCLSVFCLSACLYLRLLKNFLNGF